MIGWLALVGKARSASELCELTRYYIATLTPEELATVPQHCWPRVKAVDDLRYWHDQLADAFCTHTDAAGPSQAHRELMTFFSAVIERLVLVETPAADASNEHALSNEAKLPASKAP